MTMKKVILLSSVLLAVPFMMNGETQAADCVTQNCPTLGYTEASNTGNCVKCPFGNFWACPKIEEKAVLGQCTGYAKNCKIGDILNNDGTCTTNKESGKTPIGIVVYISGGSDKCGYAMTASPIVFSIEWGNPNTDIPSLPNYTSVTTAIKDFDVSGNMAKIIQASGGDRYKYPAAYAALNYAPSAAPTSKGKWALPTAGILNSLYTNFKDISNAISKVGGTQFGGDAYHIWSSSECNDRFAWSFCITYGNGLTYNHKKSGGYGGNYVHPVIAF